MALLQGKVAFITGGGSGIGRACAVGFAAEGARVVVVDVNLANAEEVAQEVRNSGGEALAMGVDTSDSAAVAEAVRQTVATYGSLDCAVNSAGVGTVAQPFADIPEEAWDRQIAVNLNGVRWSMKYQLAEMRKQGSGSIVNISSGAGLAAVPRAGAYVAAKHAVVGMTKVAAIDHAQENIRVNAICPGYILTAMTEAAAKVRTLDVAQLCPIGRAGQPHEIADAAAWLCSDKSSYVTGVALPVDGGYQA
ncbi:NAD(P)-dependent dehydrogenase (short-subunit alcohol dehydrogenase family) [Novosphingobium hassiacum]|uniref:NAD(P)-dependent dehydrogenase (Short-subunit alcohol dehydrogenase family) n=1 Tax=Novosphingobium hassiacum TaxID=173676 RepID=A0A7W6EW45_9SPHN|nr:NAD(P)-dependent dehydrogenase (short-subunit alcohol dehydrogenase family) [Novosphingobium hassiacum]